MRDLSEKYFPIIRKLEGSGLTMEAFSKQKGINIKTLHYWKRKYRDLHLPAFRPANLGRGQKPKEKQNGFARLALTTDERREAISVCYGDGTRISFPGGCDAAFVKQFIPALQ